MLAPGDCVVVPRGIEHRTRAEEEALIMCFEPAGTINTGNVKESTYTATREVI
jgi:mannose-6-phosphate isomerase-like protein (cupin superfamily)